jgi:hypothetical protein
MGLFIALIFVAFILQGIWMEYIKILQDSRIMYHLSFTNFNPVIPLVWLIFSWLFLWHIAIRIIIERGNNGQGNWRH